MSIFTALTPKHLMAFFGLDRYEKARKLSVLIRDTYSTEVLTAKHLAMYLGLPDAEILAGLKGKK